MQCSSGISSVTSKTSSTRNLCLHLLLTCLVTCSPRNCKPVVAGAEPHLVHSQMHCVEMSEGYIYRSLKQLQQSHICSVLAISSHIYSQDSAYIRSHTMLTLVCCCGCLRLEVQDSVTPQGIQMFTVGHTVSLSLLTACASIRFLQRCQ